MLLRRETPASGAGFPRAPAALRRCQSRPVLRLFSRELSGADKSRRTSATLWSEPGSERWSETYCRRIITGFRYRRPVLPDGRRRHHGAVAQLGERRVRNAKVGSSNLLRSTSSYVPTVFRRSMWFPHSVRRPAGCSPARVWFPAGTHGRFSRMISPQTFLLSALKYRSSGVDAPGRWQRVVWAP